MFLVLQLANHKDVLMDKGDRIVLQKRIRLLDRREYPAGRRGVVLEKPLNVDWIRVQLEGIEEPCVIAVSEVEEELSTFARKADARNRFARSFSTRWGGEMETSDRLKNLYKNLK